MKATRTWLAASMGFAVGTILSVLLPAQQPPAPGATVPTPQLAESSQSVAAGPVDLVLRLQHETSDGAACAAYDAGKCCIEMAHWRAQLRRVAGGGAAGAPFACAMTSMQELDQQLLAAARTRVSKDDKGVAWSLVTLSIRPMPQTPWRCVRQLVERAATVYISSIEFAVVAKGRPGEERRLVTPLPRNSDVPALKDDEAPHEIRVAVLRERNSGALIRWCGRQKFSSDKVGDDQLKAALRSHKQDFAKIGDLHVPGIVDADGDLPWQVVVDVVDAMRSAGIDTIEFAQNGETK